MPSKFRKKRAKKVSKVIEAPMLEVPPMSTEEVKKSYPSEAIDVIKKDKKYFKVTLRYNLETKEAIVESVEKLADTLDLASYKAQQYIVNKIVSYTKRKD